MSTSLQSDKRTAGKTYSIGELARELDVTTRTIRFYEDMGLLMPQRRGQTRIYSPADRVKLKLILRGKRLGFSLNESRELIELYNPSTDNNVKQLQALLDKIDEKRAQLRQQLHDIEVMQLELDEAERRCKASMKDIRAAE
ncbi:MerR family transcriptional regulator [Isoalcanivorax beigongshangi]|uniref:MerR family DNA-binding transcriptional regulator n=1 Tax=Isoalcanivorax beigongshangi TaxID=3238810 RepID=A0ABV4AIM6_9GAMM